MTHQHVDILCVEHVIPGPIRSDLAFYHGSPDRHNLSRAFVCRHELVSKHHTESILMNSEVSRCASGFVEYLSSLVLRKIFITFSNSCFEK